MHCQEKCQGRSRLNDRRARQRFRESSCKAGIFLLKLFKLTVLGQTCGARTNRAMGWNQHRRPEWNAIILQGAKMGGHISRRILRLALSVAAVLCSGCDEGPKHPPRESPFVEQQAIVSYDEIKKGELTVQIGEVHKSLNVAVIVAARLRASSIANFIETTENCEVYRVCVGKFRSTARAQRVKEDLLRKNLRCGEIQVMGPLKEKVGPCK